MVYMDYVMIKRQYMESLERVNAILNEMEEMFNRTQAKAIRYDLDKVKTNNTPNVIEQYIIAKEQSHVEERFEEAKKLLRERQYLLFVKERELRNSRDKNDVVYVLRYLDRMRIKKISKTIHYSEAQIYRILDRIKKNINAEYERTQK